MNRVWVIADTHLGHAVVAAARGYASVEAHDYDLVARWNAVVKEQDTVWHLGDVYLGGAQGAGLAALRQLRGLKRLVLGNHDVYPLALYQQHFSKIFGAAERDGCLLTHVPCHESQLVSRYRLNVHGHLHDKIVRHPADCTWYPDERYRCVSAEQQGLAPRLLNEVLQ